MDLGIKNSWNTYWFARVAPIGFALFRIAFGLVLLLYHVPRLWYVSELYTRDGYLFPMRLFFVLHLPVLSFPWILLFNIILILAIIFFIVGYKTRYAAVIIFVLHTYLSLLERFSTKGYGTIMIIYSLLIIWSPCAESFSVDAAIKRFRRIIKGASVHERSSYSRVPVTMQRIMLWQLADIYFFNALSKLIWGGQGWFNGQHLLNIYRDTENFARPFALPFLSVFKSLPIALGTLIPSTVLFIAFGLMRRNERPYAIMFGIIYHLFALITTTVPYVFTFLIFSLYIIAIEPEVWERWWSMLLAYFRKKSAVIFYDDACALCRRTIAAIYAADMFERIKFVALSSLSGAYVMVGDREINRQELLHAMYVKSSNSPAVKGLLAYRVISRMIPLFWIFVPFLYIPGARLVGTMAYSFVARNHKNICRMCGL